MVEFSWKHPLAFIKDYGQLPPLAQSQHKAIFQIESSEFETIKGTQENLEQSKEEFAIFANNIITRLEKY